MEVIGNWLLGISIGTFWQSWCDSQYIVWTLLLHVFHQGCCFVRSDSGDYLRDGSSRGDRADINSAKIRLGRGTNIEGENTLPVVNSIHYQQRVSISNVQSNDQDNVQILTMIIATSESLDGKVFSMLFYWFFV